MILPRRSTLRRSAENVGGNALVADDSTARPCAPAAAPTTSRRRARRRARHRATTPRRPPRRARARVPPTLPVSGSARQGSRRVPPTRAEHGWRAPHEPPCPMGRKLTSKPLPRNHKRRGWDSNPRPACTGNGFQDRPIRLLSPRMGGWLGGPVSVRRLRRILRSVGGNRMSTNARNGPQFGSS